MFRPHESMMKRFQLESPRPKNANGEQHGHSWCVKSLGVIFVLVSSLLGQGGGTSKVTVTAVEGESSGTNQFHGTLYEFVRNEKLDANDWFNNFNGVPRAPLRHNDFGGTEADQFGRTRPSSSLIMRAQE